MNTADFNKKITDQAKVLEGEMKAKGTALGIVHRRNSPSSGSSLRKLKAKVKEKDGLVNKISYSFPRQLIYTHKGAGKGKGGIIGSRWQNKYGETVKTNPRSFGKAGTGNRKEKPFIDQAVRGPEGITKIADIAVTEIGAIVTGNLFIEKNDINKK